MRQIKIRLQFILLTFLSYSSVVVAQTRQKVKDHYEDKREQRTKESNDRSRHTLSPHIEVPSIFDNGDMHNYFTGGLKFGIMRVSALNATIDAYNVQRPWLATQM